jgi:PhnB protein
MRVEPYVYFQGRCDEALEFYRGAIGADATVFARFEDKVAHAVLSIGDTTVLASDGQGESQPDFSGFSLSLTVSDDGEAERHCAGAYGTDAFRVAPRPGRRQVRRAVDGRVTECDGVTYPFHSRRETTSR